MADLYGVAPSPTPDPEEISAFLLNQFLHNSSPSASCHPLNSKYIHSLSPAVPDSLPPEAAGIGGSRKVGESERRARDGSSGVNISDPGAYYTARAKDRGESAFFSVGDVSGESEKALELSDARSNSERPRVSSKRSRAAEVHNMSEKRRRSRINEKMKALQNLIPNSNKIIAKGGPPDQWKMIALNSEQAALSIVGPSNIFTVLPMTDKASMLDEAIDYLKQLQLQVQMLTMRNGLSLYPVCIPGILQPMQLPPTGMAYDEGNDFFSAGTGAGALSANEDSPIHAPYDLANQCSISNQNVGVASGPSISNLATPFGFETSASAHYGSFSQSLPSKDACKDEYSTDLQMQRNRAARTNPSSGVS